MKRALFSGILDVLLNIVKAFRKKWAGQNDRICTFVRSNWINDNMHIPFTKYHGTGNDFILIDKRQFTDDLTEDNIALMCHRRFGIGADGLIYLMPSASFDFEMIYFNADGKEGSMCGNGGRCISAFANQLGIFDKNTEFKAIDGIHKAKILIHRGNEYRVRIQMQNVDSIIKQHTFFDINTGSPHYVEFIESIDQIDAFDAGRKIRYDDRYLPYGTNVNFVEYKSEQIHVRTYERGVEDITLSCGTGVTASAIATAEKFGLNSGHIDIKTLGGDLKVYFKKEGTSYKNILLEGAATRVFSGVFEL